MKPQNRTTLRRDLSLQTRKETLKPPTPEKDPKTLNPKLRASLQFHHRLRDFAFPGFDLAR